MEERLLYVHLWMDGAVEELELELELFCCVFE